MLGPEWSEGCKSCSFWADNFNSIIVHLNQRDATMVAISRAPLEKLLAFQKRMGWTFKWLSSFGNDFNRDYHVSFTPEELEKGEMYYNYRVGKFGRDEAPGLSVFHRDASGTIFHTYSCYGRGLDMLNGAYHHLDVLPNGRDEAGLSYPQEWVKHHDKY
jgi:predicted dithiol-disulfide oxidoreductase (DUF899 family)